MAEIGLRYAAFAPVSAHTEGSAITYGAGKEVGMMISADVTITRNSNRLYANDVVAEEDNSITDAQIKINLDDLSLADEKFMCGLTESGTSQNTHYEDTDDPAPLGGFGYVRVRSKTNQSTGVTAKTYIATWWYKVRARIETESSKSKGQQLEWSTPVMMLRAQGSYIDNTDKLKFRDRKEFTSYADAKAYIDDYAGITA